jgi:hypothetical protein
MSNNISVCLNAFAAEVGTCINLDSCIAWEENILWATSSTGYRGGSKINALCAGCHLHLHTHYFSLTACDRRVTWTQMLLTTTSCCPREWLSDRGTLHWHWNGHLSSLPSANTDMHWLTFVFVFLSLPGQYTDNCLNWNLFRILTHATLTVVFPAH